ncbi:hypothetical protein J5N97_023398 [Dioscorea zingiberensis]|uniref:Sulfotransferase n=1 Tax=Dioscorea zingiberensis TaxID=325984 RepID=A0A9D5H7S7_9LILI|nr:hypothetical protein J5N97_023398 [Dioscorea zingiberensis]
MSVSPRPLFGRASCLPGSEHPFSSDLRPRGADGGSVDWFRNFVSLKKGCSSLEFFFPRDIPPLPGRAFIKHQPETKKILVDAFFLVKTKEMALTLKFSIIFLLLSLVSASSYVSSDKDDFSQCESTVKDWAESSIYNGSKEDKLSLKDLLFFLHIPRTGGRSYFYCFLRKLYTSYQECPRSYDKLRFDPSKPNCRLMVTHDDYSLMSKLPKEQTSVVTVLRNPIDRVFSSYEFAIEVAARFLVHPNLTSATQMSRRIRPKSRGVSTLDIWPWKYLVPWMREDLFARRDARKSREVTEIEYSIDPYNMEEMIMPLHTFINHPVVHEIIHNGATFQVAGLTNNSYLEESHDVRHCVRKHPELGKFVLDVAKSRLDHMLYVGITEEHKKSATMFANMVGAQVLSQSEALSLHFGQETVNRTDSEGDESIQSQLSTNDEQQGEVPTSKNAKLTNGNQMTVQKLMDDYEICISSLRKSQSARRTFSLKWIAPANFSNEGRLMVPEEVLLQILALNSLDVELYKYAQNIFAQEQKHLMHTAEHYYMGQQKNASFEVERWKQLCQDLYLCHPWNMILSVVMMLLIIALVVVVVTARRRTSKLKV